MAWLSLEQRAIPRDSIGSSTTKLHATYDLPSKGLGIQYHHQNYLLIDLRNDNHKKQKNSTNPCENEFLQFKQFV